MNNVEIEKRAEASLVMQETYTQLYFSTNSTQITLNPLKRFMANQRTMRMVLDQQ